MISLILAIQIAAAPANGAPPTDAEIRACRLQLAPAQTPLAGSVMFACWSRAVSLGKADKFSSSYNPDTRGTVAVLETGAGRKVLLISPAADNSPVVEDITRDLAKLAGRYRDAGLNGLSVDLSRFATDGTLSLTNGGITAETQGAIKRPMPAFVDERVFDAKPFAAHAQSLATPSIAPSPTGDTGINHSGQ